MKSNGKRLIAIGMACAALAVPAFGAEEVIDDFSSATNTAFVTGIQVRQATVVGINSAVDTNLAGVLGGTRMVDVDLGATGADGVLGVTAGANVGLGLFQYSEDATADGSATLTYPEIPIGLNFADGIEIAVNADASAAIGYSLIMTLTDNSANSETVSLSSMQTGLGIPFDFSFASFPSVNPGDLDSISIVLDGGGSQDIQFDLIGTFGTPPRETLDVCQDGEDNDNDGLIDCLDPDCLAADPCGAPAPALSVFGLGMSVLMLLGAGFLAMLRLRRSA